MTRLLSFLSYPQSDQGWHPSSVVRRPASFFTLSSSFSGPASLLRSGSFAGQAGIRRPSSGFTLLEMMLVIGIIAILAGLLFPVVIGAGRRAREKQAMAETRMILMAIKAYRQEYGKWPAQRQAAMDTTYIVSNYWVIKPLLGSNWHNLNPKNKIFLHLQVNTNNPDYAGNYLDPWGIPYVICMDEDGNNSLLISNVLSYTASNTSGREIGYTNIYLTNYPVANVDAGVASLGGTSNTLPWNTWTETL